MVEAVRLAESVASGDLSSLVRVHCTDEVGRLLQAMAAMQLRLGEMVNGIRSSVDGIKRTSVEIASGNHDLSLRTERTAKSLQSTALAMEQLSATVSQSTQSACSVHELVSNASQRAEQGGHVVSEVVANMQQIAQSSHRIGDIIGVIDGIAFQTNILALNAAVEAARAGEQGRGFAVVAAEVRALAQRSAAAAKEIKVLIEASVDKVGQGSKLVDQAGQTMQDLMSQVHGVSDLISSITTASQAQSDGVGQVSGAVIELDQATKQNASLVHETSRSAGHLQSESERLYEAVSVFKLAS
jgi:methyl-accepting chemotaxis protein